VEIATLPHEAVEYLLLEGVQQLHVPFRVAKELRKTPSKERGQGVDAS
jgi:hypothetical protein